MKAKQFFIAISALFVFGLTIFAQTDEDKNWLSNFNAPYLPSDLIFYEYKFYTKEDVAKAKERLNLIEKSSPKDEWEGTYSDNSGLGIGLINWNSDGGFINFFYYHWLKTLDYGKISTSDDAVNLMSEKTSPAKLLRNTPKLLIKVKYGERHYLVPESYIKEFCEEAVGISQSIFEVSDYWTKQTDYKKPVFGLPIVPAEYRKFVRQPINANIIKTGERKLIQEKTEDGTVYREEIRYYVTLDAGKNKGVKPEMDFYITNTGEWLEIDKVSQNTSVGFIRRSFDNDKREECLNGRKGSGETIPCKEIKTGMKVFTKF